MNLLFLTFAYLPSTGGVQRSVRNLAAGFVNRGHRVTIAADGPWSGIASRGLQRGEPADVLVLQIPVPAEWRSRRRLRSLCRDCYNLLRLALLCRQRQIDIIHCHLLNVDTRYATTLRKVLGVKILITLRGSELSAWVHGRPHRVEYVRQMLRSADFVTALNQVQLGDARAMEPSLQSTPMAVITNPADIQSIRAAVDVNYPLPPRPYLLFAGRFASVKGLDTLIQAYHGLHASDPSFPADLILAGSGDLAGVLKEQASGGAAAARIQFPGQRTWPEVLRLIQGASFVILPSYEAEGCSNVLMEAMALGTPVIVSDNPRLLEMVTPGENGEVFRRRDAASLQACLARVSFDPTRREEYARAGLRHLESRHQFPQILGAYEEIYKKLCPDTR